MSTTRRHFTAEQKAQIVRRHLAGKEPISALADELAVQPSQIHLWVNQLLSQADRAFERTSGQSRRAGNDAKERRIQQLEAKLVQKNEVIAELMEDNVRSKKANGEL